MINPERPDFENTPVSLSRPRYDYSPQRTRPATKPTVSIITPYFNTSDVFLETIQNVQHMSFQQWEWVIVDDGSTDLESLARLAWLEQTEPRARVIHQANSGPAVARNQAARAATGRFIAQLDSDDLIEPTFIEKCVWLLETQPQFAFCNAYNVTFGAKAYLWQHGFHEYEACLNENTVPNFSVIRREAFFDIGGFDESVRRGHEDWDFWLSMAGAGHWGYTIPEYLTWYRRTNGASRIQETESDKRAAAQFRRWLRSKHANLYKSFPHPERPDVMHQLHAIVPFDIPVENRLAKITEATRVLFMLPSMETGDVDKRNLDVIRVLSRRGYDCTVAATVASPQISQHEFTAVTPDVFCLDRFLVSADYPRFLSYLIESRAIDAILISHDEHAYSLIPYLRSRHPEVAFLDYNHQQEQYWKDDGFPAISIRAGDELDVHVTSSRHLQHVMVEHGADEHTTTACYTSIDTNEWDPDRYDRHALRTEIGVAADVPLILFVGDTVDHQRPIVWTEIIRQLAERDQRFLGLVIGTGDRLSQMKAFVHQHKLRNSIRFLGMTTNDRMRALMAASDILLLPSATDDLALVLFECMAMRIVPVAANVGGRAELISTDCGFLIDPSEREIDEYVAALAMLIKDSALRNDMRERSRSRVADAFGPQRMGDAMDGAIHQARARAHGRTSDTYAQTVGRHMAHVAVDYWRMSAVSDRMRMTMGMSASSGGRMRVPLKRRLLPFGSRRRELYTRVRLVIQLVITTPLRRVRRRQSAGIHPSSEHLQAGGPATLRANDEVMAHNRTDDQKGS